MEGRVGEKGGEGEGVRRERGKERRGEIYLKKGECVCIRRHTHAHTCTHLFLLFICLLLPGLSCALILLLLPSMLGFGFCYIVTGVLVQLGHLGVCRCVWGACVGVVWVCVDFVACFGVCVVLWFVSVWGILVHVCVCVCVWV